VVWCLEAVLRLEAASRQIFAALILDFTLASWQSKIDVLVLKVSVLSQDRDQDTNLQGKMQHSTLSLNHCDTNTKLKVRLEILLRQIFYSLTFTFLP